MGLITASLYLLIVFFSAQRVCIDMATAESTPIPSWQKSGKLEKLLQKPRGPLYLSHGGIMQIKVLLEKKEISSVVAESELKRHYGVISDFLDESVSTEAEAMECVNFFLSPASASSASAFFSFTTVLLILAIGFTVIGALLVASIHILPLLVSMSHSLKICFAYAASLTTIGAAHLLFAKGTYGQATVACFGAIFIAASYSYHLSFYSIEKPNISLVLFPLFAAFTALAVLFKTKIIGFLTVAIFEAMMGFFILSGPLSTTIGFTDHSSVYAGLISSGTLLAMYISYVTSDMRTQRLEYLEVFETGILFIGTFVFFTALLILSSRFFQGGNLLFYNLLTIACGLGSFYLGYFRPDTLGTFRGVASTFFVIFIMQKWIEIQWRDITFAVLGGGLLVVGLCLFAKSHPHLFFMH